jgi:hypothetical protein
VVDVEKCKNNGEFESRTTLKATNKKPALTGGFFFAIKSPAQVVSGALAAKL